MISRPPPAQESPPIRFSPFTPAQAAFLGSLRAGARPTSICRDALTVGPLMRLRLVAWNEERRAGDRFRRTSGTFSLTALGLRLLREHEARRQAPA